MTITKISWALLEVARVNNQQQYKPVKVEMSEANLCVYDEDVGLRAAALHHNPPTHDSLFSTDSALTPPNQTRLSNIKPPAKI